MYSIVYMDDMGNSMRASNKWLLFKFVVSSVVELKISARYIGRILGVCVCVCCEFASVFFDHRV